MQRIILPGAAAAAVMSSSKVTTVLRPTSQLPNAATAQPAVQHIIHQPIQARPGCGIDRRESRACSQSFVLLGTVTDLGPEVTFSLVAKMWGRLNCSQSSDLL